MRDNDHVELHDVRGFVSDDIVEAFHEADAIAKGTRATNHLFSLSLKARTQGRLSKRLCENAAICWPKEIDAASSPLIGAVRSIPSCQVWSVMMSTLGHNFNEIAEDKARSANYPPPFSIRFTFEERARLDAERGRHSLAAHMNASASIQEAKRQTYT